MESLCKSGLTAASLLSLWSAACGQPRVVYHAPGTIPSFTFPSSPAAHLAAAPASRRHLYFHELKQDENGQGRMTYRADYHDGRVAKVERETRGHGRVDLWVTYDTRSEGEVIVKEERDLNGDGFPDLWSHYNRGRLVRRDLNSIGLEVFSKQDEGSPRDSDDSQGALPGS